MASDPPRTDETNNLKGLSSNQAAELLERYGPNTVSEKKVSRLSKILRWLMSPMSILLIAASTLSFSTHKVFDGWFILFLFITNFLIAQWHEAKADHAIAELQKHLAVNVQVLRDGQWRLVPSSQIVPGDVVQFGVGGLVPADIEIVEDKNLSINESVLTGESLPREKSVGGIAYSGSFVTTGSFTGIVQSTGNQTKFGKTVTMVDTKPKNSTLERDILTISKYLLVLSVIGGAIITAYMLAKHQAVSDLLRLDLSILIAGVPVAMPTVMSLIISLGVMQLTRKQVIVRRLSSLEDLANVNLLLSDKTGTLTQNEIQIESMVTYGNTSQEELVQFAASATNDNKLDPINQAIINLAKQKQLTSFKQTEFVPADSKRKRSTATIELNGAIMTVSMGAPQIIEGLCNSSVQLKGKFEADVAVAAKGGYRSLAIAVSNGSSEKEMRLVGILNLSDTLRPQAAGVIDFMKANGIDVKMVTGDNRSIAARVAQKLGLTGRVLAATGQTANLTVAQIAETGVFAEVLPDDKYHIVEVAAKKYVVASTGDGVNDLPALKKASVGIAVKNAVDALKSAADIVLMTDGIDVIRDAIIEARKIFLRTYYYSIYRISESSRLIISIVLLSLIYGGFPLTPVQIILLALLNDLPIVSLAYDRVTTSNKPASINVKERFELATLLGLIGVVTSLTFFWVAKSWLKLDMSVIQTMFFLKLAVSGHMLIYVAHTKSLWWRWLPSKEVIWATSLTQCLATAVALSGFFFHSINIRQAIFVWVWALAWMQVAELSKQVFFSRSKQIT